MVAFDTVIKNILDDEGFAEFITVLAAVMSNINTNI
jgi:hypothetical protein